MKKKLRTLTDGLRWSSFALLLAAGIINAIGVTMFLAPVHLYDSGISGTSMLLWQITPERYTLSLFLLLLNTPLFLFGWRKQGTVFTVYSLWAVLVYILMGAVGLPVFSGFAGGLGKLLGMTGGYIVGFLVSALLMWAMEALFGSKKWVLPVSMVVGLIACYAFGTAWFMVVYTSSKGAITLGAVLGMCVIPYIIPDAVKIAVALLLTKALKRFVK